MPRILSARQRYARALSRQQFGKPYGKLTRSERSDLMFYTDGDFARMKKAGLEVTVRKPTRRRK